MKLLAGLSLLAIIPSSIAVPTNDNQIASRDVVLNALPMLKPQRSLSRDLVNLDGLWKFSVATSPNSTAQPWTGPLVTDLECPVPASYNDIFVDRAIHDHVGWVYYQRDVIVPKGWSGEQYFVRAESATHEGQIYVNDRLVAHHVGGYTPFEADVTDLVTAGQQFRLTIAVNNILTFETLPPGKVMTSALTGKRTQKYYHDFYNYAGLARSVWLYSVPKQHIQDITVVTDYKGNTGMINYNITVAKGTTGKVQIAVIDESGKTVAEGSGATGTINIPSVKLWQPGAAYLYNFRASIVDSSKKTLDTYNLATGIRTVVVKNTQFLINGKPFYFTGFGKHEDTNVRGKGHDQAYMVHDFQLLNWIGANSFRTSHYPYTEEMMEYADRRGIVVIDETPAVGLNFGLGTPGSVTFGPDLISNKTQAAHAQAIRELIHRDKNHASVVMWSIANEPASDDKGARAYFEPLAALTRSLDSSRPITFANVFFATYLTDKISDLFDVLCLNRYYGWYTETGELADAEVALTTEMQGWVKKFNKPIVMTEYGADTVSGLHTVLGLPWSEEYQVAMLAMYHRVFDSIKAMAGEHVWNFADFQTSMGTGRVDGNKKGVFTRDRRPKAAAHALKERWTNMKKK
ncbi:hypothetical protein V501_05777 [Pseudogymnoascus sp. VKM F-4519 (FW-2642)]|nr:hypothetical protein V501_05777 [Pseudogymnoascus sp. VKM F-4519 (FW-2642)]